MPRCWKTRDGDVLVEDPLASDSRKYYLLRTGQLWRTYEKNDCSLDDSLYRLRYAVVDNRLEETLTEEVYCEERKRQTSTELDGLAQLTDMPLDELQAAVAAHGEA